MLDQQFLFIAFGLFITVAGSVIAMRLFARVRRTAGGLQLLWLFLAGLIGGGTIWSAQLLGLLGLNGASVRGFDTLTIALALVAAIGITNLGFYVAARTERSALIEMGGAIIGFGVAGIHYLGTSALLIDGRPGWTLSNIALTLLLGGVFGALITNRIARPVTRFCKYGGALAFMLTIALVSAAGFAGVYFAPQSVDHSSMEIVSKPFISGAILVATLLLLSAAAATYMIDRRASEESTSQVRHLTMHDALTGLPNRASFEQSLESSIARHRDDTARTAVVLLNLDRFNEINDVHGRSAGDAMLCAIGDRLANSTADDVWIGRNGSDEFIAVKHPVYTQREAQQFCRKLRELTNLPVEWQDSTIFIGASAGLALYPDHGDTPAELLERAELAKRRAKAEGGDRFAIYDPKVDEANRQRSALAADLRKAVANGELELHYQQQNDTASLEIVGFEALLRWNHPTQGQISPFVFIPIAEETGLIEELGEWALREACREAASWKTPYKVAVNVAAAQIAAATLPGLVQKVLTETGLPASRLELEITETGIINDQAHALQIVGKLKALGLSIAMDDFGTGYSSLSTLKNFPFDKIKIDREFIKDVHTDNQLAAIVKATVVLADGFEIPVLAEGVETEAHLGFLKGTGCREVQGYLFGKPMPVADVRRLTGYDGPAGAGTNEADTALRSAA